MITFPAIQASPVYPEGVVFRRKYRWTVEAEFPFGKLQACFARVSARPKTDEPEINFLEQKFPAPGETTDWKELDATWFEVDAESDPGKELYGLMSESYQLWDVSRTELDKPVEPPEDKLGTVWIRLYDGCGNLMEEWTLKRAYFASFNFGVLDYGVSCQDVTVKIRYKDTEYVQRMGFAPTEYVQKPEACPHYGKDLAVKSMGLGKLGMNQVFFD